jgi:hypothetical protein
MLSVRVNAKEALQRRHAVVSDGVDDRARLVRGRPGPATGSDPREHRSGDRNADAPTCVQLTLKLPRCGWDQPRDRQERTHGSADGQEGVMHSSAPTRGGQTFARTFAHLGWSELT